MTEIHDNVSWVTERGDFTSQEHAIIGRSEIIDGKSIGNPYTATRLSMKREQGEIVTADEIVAINKRRAEQKIAGSFIVSALLKRDDVGFSLEQLDDQGNTTRDPQVMRFDPETKNFSLDVPLTQRMRSGLQEWEQRKRKNDPEHFNEWTDSFFLREVFHPIETEERSSEDKE